MRKTIQGFALVLIATGCGGASSAAPQPVVPVSTTSVNLSSNAFSPGAIRVSPGAVVTFTNLDGIAHNLTFTSAGITSVGNFTTGARQVAMPNVPGTYDYHCTIHAGMSGSVQVQ
ncbi:MAG: plastocyanin/azurin family copper-binding protein [Gemmatimonadaceae bacterium]